MIKMTSPVINSNGAQSLLDIQCEEYYGPSCKESNKNVRNELEHSMTYINWEVTF